MEENQMKKIIALVLALVMVMALAACGTPAPETTAPKADAPETQGAPRPLRLPSRP